MRLRPRGLTVALISYVSVTSLVAVALAGSIGYAQAIEAAPGRAALALLVVGLASAAVVAVGSYVISAPLRAQMIEHARELQHAREAQAKLHVAEHFYESLVQNSPVAIVTWNGVNRTVASWNPAAERLFGYTESEAIGQDMVSLIVPDNRREEGEGYSAALLSGEPVYAIAQRKRKDGSTIDVELWGVPVLVDDRYAGTILVYHDVTELLSAKERLESLVRNSPVAIVTWADSDGAAEQLFGYTAAEAIGQTLDALITSGGQRAEADAYSQAARRGEQVRVLTQRTRRDGSIVDVELLAVPIEVSGLISETMVVYHDVTEVLRAKEYFQSLVEYSPVAIITWAGEHRTISSWNPAAETLFGYTASEAIGQDVVALLASDAQRGEAESFAAAALRTEHVRGLLQRTRKDGSTVDVEMLAVPVVVAGQPAGVITVYHDVTELLRTRHAAEAANQAKSAFLATMSHEIRTPMNAVIGMSGLLLGTELSPEQREYAELVRSSGESLLTIINDILDFSKIEAGKMELERAVFDPHECVEGALDLLAIRAAEKNLELACIVDASVPRAVVGDLTRLRQVIVNLLNNAVKFTERGEVVVSVAAHAVEDGGYELQFAVRDTGIGIPADGLARLFQPFSQVDPSTSRKYGGTGLGLAISRRLCELMSGGMAVQSTPGHGTTFNFTVLVDAASEVPSAAGPAEQQPPLMGRLLLVVDDNDTNRTLVVQYARTWGMLVNQTSSPAEALAWIQGGVPFDIAVLDAVMPEMDGTTLAAHIREHRAGLTLPLVLLSALGRRDSRADGVDFAGYVSKPLKASNLLDVVMNVLTDRPTRQRALAEARQTPDARMAERLPLRILVAEDNAVNQKLALRLLGQLGYNADVAADGLEVLAALERQRYDVVLMDVQMPELDGLDATRRICQRWPHAERPRIVAMTANAMQGDREVCLDAGMDDYIGKPIYLAELVAALSRSGVA